MKGTLFSADFVEDINGNLRLTEVNTDTTISANNLIHFDYGDFISLLSDNNITKVTVVHKPNIHQDLVNHLSQSLNDSAPFVTTFTEVKELPNRIYPTSVNDEDGLFILRMAYDESAIFDSEYAKGTLNLLKLFADAGESNKVVDFYHSSSLYGSYNTLSPEFNTNNVPDFLTKNVSDENNSFIGFYKVGSESSDDTELSRFQTFVSNVSSDSNLIQKYHVSSDVTSNQKAESFRTFSIIHGSDLSLIHLAKFKETSVFSLPTDSIYDSSSYVNLIDIKHYYEFATNFVKSDGNYGLLNTHLIIKADDTQEQAGNIVVGDELKSYYLGGTNVVEDDFSYLSWKIDGTSLPTGSFVTSSVVIFKKDTPLTSKQLSNIEVNNNTDSVYVSTTKAFLVYESGSNAIKWKYSAQVEPSIDYLIDYDGSTAQVTKNDILIINEDSFSLVEIDVEDTDTYIIAGETPVNTFVTHNSPCFVAGTQIKTGEGFKSIEDIVVGDIVLTWNFENGVMESKQVKNIFNKLVSETVEYVFENEVSLKGTSDHPIYVKDKGWCAHKPSESNSTYNLESPIKQVEIGDLVHTLYGDLKLVDIIERTENVMVYNLHEVEDNHNFYANDVLVHNRGPLFVPKL